jgi:hypothetical protein
MNEEGFLSDGNDKIRRAEPVLDPIGDGNPESMELIENTGFPFSCPLGYSREPLAKVSSLLFSVIPAKAGIQ